MKQLRIFFLCLVAATLVTACGGDDKDNSTPVEKITSLEMDVTGSSVTSENCELVLDTAENAIKLRIKATAY